MESGARAAARRLWLWISIPSAVCLFGLLGATVTYWSRRELGQQTRSYVGQVIVETLFWLTYLPLIPMVLKLARRFRLDPSPWQQRARLAIHILGASCFSLAHAMIATLIQGVLLGEPRWSHFLRFVASFSLLDFCLYWTALTGYYAISFYKESVNQSLAAAHLRADLTEAKLQALRTQLTPHFLFNTLNCLSTLSLTGDQIRLRAMIANLGALLRFSLDDQCPQEIPLGRDLDLVEQYVDLQRLQFGDLLKLSRDIELETLEAFVPTFVLQPLVENAIVHGYARGSRACHIAIRAVRDGDMLRLAVQDDGPGFPAAGAPSREGVGLKNTEGRLRQLYGATQHIEFRNAPEGGAIVTISLPFHCSPISKNSLSSRLDAA